MKLSRVVEEIERKCSAQEPSTFNIFLINAVSRFVLLILNSGIFNETMCISFIPF